MSQERNSPGRSFGSPTPNELGALKIIIVVGRFPQLSETFIWRKVLALRARGHQVLVATREHRRAEGLLATSASRNLQVSELVPEWGFSAPGRLWRAVVGGLWYSARRPMAAMLLLLRCHRDPRTARNPNRQFLRHLWFLGRQCDVLHFEFLPLAGMYPLAAELMKTHEVVSCRGADLHMLPQADADLRHLALDSLARVGLVHCVSAEMAAWVERVSGRRRGVFVNRPAVDPSEGTRPPESNTVPLIVSVGRLVWKKGFDYLLAALAMLKCDGVAFRAEIIGGGPLEAELRFSVVDLDLDHHVIITGPRPASAVQRRLREADIFVLSSVEEGISNAALEAMAAGVPIVTTAAGGMAEAVADGREGFVVPVRDVGTLAARLRELLLNQSMRVEFGRAARARVSTDFSLARQAAVFEHQYRSLIGECAEDGAI